MHFSNIILPLTLALGAVAEPLLETRTLPPGLTPARQFRRSSNLQARQNIPDLDPQTVCGSGFDDCGDGYCCSSGETCAGTLRGIAVCKAPGFTLGPLKGTNVAKPYADLEDKIASMSSLLAAFTNGALTEDDNKKTTAVSGDEPTNTGSAQNSQGTGAAVRGASGFGNTATVVMGLWGAAAIGGAGWFFA